METTTTKTNPICEVCGKPTCLSYKGKYYSVFHCRRHDRYTVKIITAQKKNLGRRESARRAESKYREKLGLEAIAKRQSRRYHSVPLEIRREINRKKYLKKKERQKQLATPSDR